MIVNKNRHESFSLLGVRINPLTINELHKIIGLEIENNKKAIISNVNAHALNLTFKLPWLRDFFNTSDIVFCDGAGVILGGKLLGLNIPERITYADWMWQLGALCNSEGYSLFLLGGKEGVANKAAVKLQGKYSRIKILGTHHGYFNKSFASSENEAVINIINEAHPDILIVCFGMPLQEHWLNENWEKINANIALTGGAALDYVSGELKRGPKWLTDNGFEWLARLIIEPKRLWKRYIVGNPIFLMRILMQKMGVLKLK